jgi:tRNA dimethylallyltransferase
VSVAVAGVRDAAVICLMGPTASGKSAAAMQIAAQFPIDIISVDSALVYRGMDIGTAKPSAAERAAVPHHLIDIAEPEEPYSAARFVADAKRCIEEIRQRDRIPLLVGGTMLYFRALQQGLDAMPGADPQVRALLAAKACEIGWPAMHDELAKIDPITAQRLAKNDAQRIQRAIEVFMLSGKPLSAWHGRAREGSGAEWINVALMPSDRAVLHRRIAYRFEAMLDHGLLDEVRTLMQRPALSSHMPSMRAVGYRQAWAYLSGEGDQVTMRDKALASTRQLAKHQITWLRSTTRQITIDCVAPDAPSQLALALARLLQTHL